MSEGSKTCLSYWFPRIEAAGLPVPRTIWRDLGMEVSTGLCGLIDGPGHGDPKALDAVVEFVMEAIWRGFRHHLGRGAGKWIGLPAFLRTGQTSAKHDWTRSCYLSSVEREQIAEHVMAIVEYSALADILGLPCNVWAVREYLDVDPIAHAYRDMPVNREFRFFVEGGKVSHMQFYWPGGALEQGRAHGSEDWQDRLAKARVLSEEDRVILEDYSVLAARVCEGDFSIDWLQTANGTWHLTDIAEAFHSFRYEGEG